MNTMLQSCARTTSALLTKSTIARPTRQFARALAGQAPPSAALDDQTRDRIDGYVKSGDVIVFMKGTKSQPMCGFSMNVKRVLDVHAVDFKDYNVLEDDKLREGIKIYSDWPTIPQVYVKGEFIGGSDILINLHKNGEITELFDKNQIPSRFSDAFPAKPENTAPKAQN